MPPGAYYAQPIAWAAWNGIVNGITSTTFAPDRNVTREQMAAILYRYTAWKGWDVSQQGNLFQFTDWQKVQAYARTPLAWAVAAGLIQGKENQRLDPGGPATRPKWPPSSSGSTAPMWPRRQRGGDRVTHHSILAPAPQNQGARGCCLEIAIAAGGCYNRKTTHGHRRTVKISLA